MLTRESLEETIERLEIALDATNTPLAKKQLDAKLDAARKQLREMIKAEQNQTFLF